MKVTTLPFVVAAMGLAAQITASPIRIYVLAPENAGVSHHEANVSPADVPVAHMRWGLAAANAPLGVTQPWVKATVGSDSSPIRKHHCGGIVRAKALAFSNWFREKVGLEPIPMSPPPHLHFPHGRPLPHRPEGASADTKFVLPSSMRGTGPSYVNGTVDGHPRFHHFHHHAYHRSSSFTGRLQRALLTLGPWEGRLVAFVIGCGIGSLLRMFYVLCVVTYRSFAGRKDEDEVEVIFAEVEEIPPQYVADEKVAA